jgi:glycolate oxidase
MPDRERGDTVYRRVDSQILAQLVEIAGQDNVLTDAERLEPYTHDETVGLRADPEVAVRVTSAQQVAEIFKLANRERIPVTPRGAGYGLSGGAVAVREGIVLSLEKMDRPNAILNPNKIFP